MTSHEGNAHALSRGGARKSIPSPAAVVALRSRHRFIVAFFDLLTAGFLHCLLPSVLRSKKKSELQVARRLFRASRPTLRIHPASSIAASSKAFTAAAARDSSTSFVNGNTPAEIQHKPQNHRDTKAGDPIPGHGFIRFQSSATACIAADIPSPLTRSPADLDPRRNRPGLARRSSAPCQRDERKRKSERDESSQQQPPSPRLCFCGRKAATN